MPPPAERAIAPAPLLLPPHRLSSSSASWSTSRPGARCRISRRAAPRIHPMSCGSPSILRSTRSASRGAAEHLPRVDCGIPVIKADRGGQITYHGPGQLIAYLLIDMRRRGLGVRPRADHGAGRDRLARRRWHGSRAACRGARSVCRRCQDRGARPARQERMLLPRAGAQRRHGSRAVSRDRPLRLPGIARNSSARARSNG